MIKKILLVTALFAISTTSFALTQSEQDDFRQTVAESSWIGYTGLLAYNVTTTVSLLSFKN